MEVTNTNARFAKGGRPKFDPADIAARRRAFQHLRKRLGMNFRELAEVTGLAPRTVSIYFSPQREVQAATWDVIDCMRAAAIRQAKASVVMAEDKLLRAESDLLGLDSLPDSWGIQDAKNILARRDAFQHLRRVLGMNRAELSKIIGHTPRGVGNLFSPSSPNVAATWATIEVMRQEAIRRARPVITVAEDRLFRAEIELQNLEREGEAAADFGTVSKKPLAGHLHSA